MDEEIDSKRGVDSDRVAFRRCYLGKVTTYEESICQRGKEGIDPRQDSSCGKTEKHSGGAIIRHLDKESPEEEQWDPPCKICGSERHAMLEVSTGVGSVERDILTCPVARQREWTNGTRLGPSVSPSQYEISKYRFAEHYDYDPDQIRRAMVKYIRDGNGQYQSSGTICLTEKRLQDICETYHRHRQREKETGRLEEG